MNNLRQRHLWIAAVLSVALHAGVGMLAGGWGTHRPLAEPRLPEPVLFMEAVAIPPPPPPAPAEVTPPPPPKAKSKAPPQPEAAAAPILPTPPSATDKAPASMAAPSAPTAEEWAFAAKYTNKNSKGYRHSWGQQVRSMMGTAVEGPDQGLVRLRVEIAPDGTLAKLETLWSTSPKAEQLARQAIAAMPPLPPTPTGKPLVFEKTIAFTPYAVDGPPIYKDDCQPDPPAFRNRFAWNGTASQQTPEDPPQPEKLDPKALEECLKQLPKDTIEAEAAHDQRLFEQWRSHKLGK